MINDKKVTGYLLSADHSAVGHISVEKFEIHPATALLEYMLSAQNAIEKLINDGHQVYIVSDVIPKIYEEKVEWLKFYFPQIDESHIVAMKHKHLFRCDIMIEDNLHNLLAKPYYERICFDYAWNRKVNDYAYGIHRVSSWDEVLNVINKLDLE